MTNGNCGARGLAFSGWGRGLDPTAALACQAFHSLSPRFAIASADMLGGEKILEKYFDVYHKSYETPPPIPRSGVYEVRQA
ncbi:MAG: hypothetical protein Q9211_003846 [Gyalolechia sp. 1 TL-2023]